jgi:hypothetical protein
MDPRDAWKALHLLYYKADEGIELSDLYQSKLSCAGDAIRAVGPELVEHITMNNGQVLVKLKEAGRVMIEKCLVANYKQGGTLIRVDYPQAFVIMPFSDKFKPIYTQMIEPAVIGAGLECKRGDSVLRIDDLTANVWSEILRAGLIIADISEHNPNVYYELGLAHAIGKDTFVLKQKGSELPADFGGVHYYEYDPNALETEKTRFENRFKEWADSRGAFKVKQILNH